MAGETMITVIGNLVEEPTVRFTPSGLAVASFRVASTPRFFDKRADEWRDGDTLFLTGTVWRQVAENLTESGLAKGTRVIVYGRLKQRSYETREGDKRTVYEIDVEEIGVSVRNATVKVTKAARHNNPQGFGGQNGGQSGGPGAAPPDDPWATGSSGGYTSDPPF